jgi:hypothetical protein
LIQSVTRTTSNLKEASVPSPKPVPLAPSTTVSLVVRTIAVGRGSRALCCPECFSPLNLIQPDENEPTRLLATCDCCAKWGVLIELEPEWRKALFIELPDGESVLREHPHLETTPPAGGDG